MFPVTILVFDKVTGLKTLREKKKILINRIFSFSYNLFKSLLLHHFSKSELVKGRPCIHQINGSYSVEREVNTAAKYIDPHQPAEFMQAHPKENLSLFENFLQTLVNWKSLQTTILNLMKNARKFCRKLENTGKRRNCSLRAISPFLTVFSKDLSSRHVNTRACLGRG